MNPNEDVFMTQRTVIRENYIGEFRMLLSSNNAINVNDFIILRMATIYMKGSSGGFSLSLRPVV
jgi:hypothetical protein